MGARSPMFDLCPVVDAPRAELAVARGPCVASVLVRAAERGEERQVLDAEVSGRWGKSITPRTLRSRGPACLGPITHVLNHQIKPHSRPSAVASLHRARKQARNSLLACRNTLELHPGMLVAAKRAVLRCNLS